MIKSQDIFILLKLVSLGAKPWSYAKLAVSLEMSPSQVHASIKRALAAQLAVRQDELIVPHIRNLEEFLIHGLKYVFVAELGEMTRGIPTAHAAPPLSDMLVSTNSEPPPVWPYAEGNVRGISLLPLYQHAPKAVQGYPLFHELLALADAIRIGRVRERAMAIQELVKRIKRDA